MLTDVAVKSGIARARRRAAQGHPFAVCLVALTLTVAPFALARAQNYTLTAPETSFEVSLPVNVEAKSITVAIKDWYCNVPAMDKWRSTFAALAGLPEGQRKAALREVAENTLQMPRDIESFWSDAPSVGAPPLPAVSRVEPAPESVDLPVPPEGGRTSRVVEGPCFTRSELSQTRDAIISWAMQTLGQGELPPR